MNTGSQADLADEVAHLFALGLEVALVGGLGGDLGGDALGDLDAGEFEGFDLVGIVGDEADGVDAELLEDLRREARSRGSRRRSRVRGWLRWCRGPGPAARRRGAWP